MQRRQFDPGDVIGGYFIGHKITLTVHFCPWCGQKLRDSKRDAWFDALEALGFEDPMSDFENIPIEYKTDA